ncbi:NAD(P)-binding protein [Clostridia bacterium]|nr:NAD(P)-binding protein [Clostridia bacterium]
MLYRIDEIKTSIDDWEQLLMDAVCRKLRVRAEDIEELIPIKRSLDARKKPQLYYVHSVALSFKEEKLATELLGKKKIVSYELPLYHPSKPGRKPWDKPMIIVGAGPAGLFAAYTLAEQGYCPLVLERGADMAQRVKEVEQFWQEGILNPESNVAFGLGGAGTFSDGKLTSRSKDPRVHRVLELFIRHGACANIAQVKNPHLGTDMIRAIVVRMKEEIERLGGTVRFGAKLTGIQSTKGLLESVEINGREIIAAETVLLCTGHSARDTYEMLQRNGVFLEPKDFAVGLRIEHPQKLIDVKQLGIDSRELSIGAAEYKLTYKDRMSGRGVYSFCMCPGGSVVNASTEAGSLCVNGMSYSNRDSGQANSAVVVGVKTQDLPGDGPLKGISYQRSLEKKAFELGGGNFAAPIQAATGFVGGSGSRDLKSSILPSTKLADLRQVFDKETTAVLQRGLRHFDKQIPGFLDQGLLVGVESRTSSPIRVTRNQDMQSLELENLYPVGEGAGYAGGIVSAAVDGIRAAEKIIEIYRRK